MRHLFTVGKRQAGFTLLELLVVMSMVGLMTGIIAPRLWQWVEGARERSGLEALLSALNSLPVQTFFNGKGQQLRLGAETALPLPAGWRLEMTTPLSYEVNGMANGGRIQVWSAGRLLADWQIVAPSGEVVNAADGSPP
jgi:general secretion pathway protein G